MSNNLKPLTRVDTVELRAFLRASGVPGAGFVAGDLARNGRSMAETGRLAPLTPSPPFDAGRAVMSAYMRQVWARRRRDGE
ncbi:MAG: hypothetical protein AB7G11_11150 [Phycisphaerales bacterium]